MDKKKTLKKRELSIADIPAVKTINEEEIEKLEVLDIDSYFTDKKEVGESLLDCLIENDPEGFMEILGAFVRINNKKRIAREAEISRVTLYNAFYKDSNPTLKTIAKIVHKATTAPKKIKRKVSRKPMDTLAKEIMTEYSEVFRRLSKS